MFLIISFCNVHFVASLCKACERFAPNDFPLTHCGSSLFTASLALEVAEHSHTHDGPSRYVLDLVAHHGYIPEQHEGGEKHTGKQSPPKQYLYALRHETF